MTSSRFIFGFDPYAKKVLWLLLLTCCVSALVACVRLFSLVYFNEGFWVAKDANFWLVLWQGLRFDVATVIRLFFPVYLLSMIAIVLPQRIGQWLVSMGFYWGVFISTSILVLTVANQGYIAFFDTPFNAFALESLAYDKHEITESVWGSGSVWVYLFAGLIAALVCVYMLKHLARWMSGFWIAPSIGFLPSLLVIILSFFLVVTLGRGGVGSFPLSHKHLIVSATPSFNNAVPNGALSVYYAVLEFIDSQDLMPADDAEGKVLYQQFFGQKAEGGALWPQLFTQTPPLALLADSPPNVVLHLVESLGTEPLLPRFNEGVDLVGELGIHLKEDMWLKNFLPEHNDTQSTLIRLLGNINYPTVTQSKYKQVSLESAAAKVFQRSGYKTGFVFTGYEGIRYRSDYFLNQGFDEFVGAHQLSQLYPEMPTNTWGGEDEYMYDYASKLVREHNQDEGPLFVVTLTTTNHPPYKVPTSFADVSIEGISTLQNKIRGLPLESLITYKYTNHHLGSFIRDVKASSKDRNTIIAATGDHGVRGLSGFEGSALLNVSVPFYLYVPTAYKPVHKLNEDQIASHKDIFPTLYHLALSEAPYLKLGRNLFTPSDLDGVHGFSASARYVATQTSAALKDKPSISFPLSPSEGLLLGKAEQFVEAEKFGSALAYKDLIDWIMRKQLKGGVDNSRN